MPNWTDNQLDAIEKKNSNILVSAAAGSGKTAVLVERIIRKIIDEKIDIDSLLVVTFTKAAASEMKGKIVKAIYDKLKEDPENNHLKKQLILINKAYICTIDSFCFDIVKNNFYDLDISPNMRTLDSAEETLLKQELLETIFEEKYINNDKEFLDLIDTYTRYNEDEALEEEILGIDRFMSSEPFPEEWLEEQVEKLNFSNLNIKDFGETEYGKGVLQDFAEAIKVAIRKTKSIISKIEAETAIRNCVTVLEKDVVEFESLLSTIDNYDVTREKVYNKEKNDWPRDNKDNLFKKEAKEQRDAIKKLLDKYYKKDPSGLFFFDTQKIVEDTTYMYQVIKNLSKLVLEYRERYAKLKRDRNLIDFTDMEHFALNILVKKNEDGTIENTEVAKMYQEKFTEIAIDEYQDSNMVQETILKSVSRGNNIFMVGDVKQSIYKFRQAMPELFKEKYVTYNVDPKENEDRLIKLYANFRSRKNVLDFSNILFENIMTDELGDVDYDESEYLNPGNKDFIEIDSQDNKIEVDIIDLKEKEDDIYKDEYSEDNDESDDEKDEDLDLKDLEDIEVEAKFVAERIDKLVRSKYQIFDKDKKVMRDIKYSDIVILLLAPRNSGSIYEQELIKRNINVYSDVSDSYLESNEINQILSLLKIINNPYLDIPLVSVLRSYIGLFNDDELLKIRLVNKNVLYFDALLEAKDSDKIDDNLKIKINRFLNRLNDYREKESYLALDEFIWYIYEDTGIMNYALMLPNGNLRTQNLKLLFEKARDYEKKSFKGLYNFINFIEKTRLSNSDKTSAKIIGENEDVVRIMSIHKSKGLEFPVVILADANRKFNLQDISKKILLSHEYGIAPKYINKDTKETYKLTMKRMIEDSSKVELISEEMRVLYVALTRPKEKLIIVGRYKDYYKSMDGIRNDIEFLDSNNKIEKRVLKSHITFLDWINLVLEKEYKYKDKRYDIDSLVEKNVIEKDSKDQESNSSDEESKKFEIFKKKVNELNLSEEEKNDIIEKISWTYGYTFKSIPSKTSVSEIKRLSLENELDNENDIKEINVKKPKFIEENDENKLTGAEKGSIIHLILQKLDFKENVSKEDIDNLFEELIYKNIIPRNSRGQVNLYNVYKFIESDFYKKISKAKEINKEVPFYINLKIKDVYLNQEIPEDKQDEKVLVQGIIDLYFKDENDKYILVDYKTDYMENNSKEEKDKLVNKYIKQLQIYKNALEDAKQIKIDKIYLYSIYLNEEIEVTL